jgi:predicted amidohydrolase
MTQSLRVSLVQAKLAWHDAEANRQAFERLLEPLAGVTDLVVLPEMFTTGFTMKPGAAAEPADGPTVEWLAAMASKVKATITGSVATVDGGEFFNRLIWMRPDGTHVSYDKRHLFRMAREHEHYAAGRRKSIVEIGSWRILPLICYDLRFPVWSRNRIGGEGEYDLLVYVANWPARRRYAWQTLLKARAIENLSYCVGVNRVGQDGAGIEYSGDSMALDYLGQPMIEDSSDELVRTVTLDRAALEEFRKKFPAHLDADRFQLLE